MRALYIQHDPGARPGRVGARLAEHGYEPVTVTISDSIDDATFTEPFPSLDGIDLLVPLGAIWSAYDQDTVGTWFDRELDLLRQAEARDVPVLGICFGSQALAAAHGGVVEPSPTPEVGWHEVDTDRPELVPAGPWMQWHSDRFSLPADAVEIARNPSGPQAFVRGRSLGVQFHPEVDTDRVASWIEMGGDGAVADAAAGGTTPERVLEQCREHSDRAADDVRRLVDAFLREVAGLPAPAAS